MRTSNRREEIERLLERRDREGLTYAEIARMAGIRPSTMSTWAWRLRRDGRRRSAPGKAREQGFVEIVTSAVPTQDARIEIELSNGRRVTVAVDIDHACLTAIVQALESC